MAQRRMFSKEVTNSSDFQMMSPSAQALYFHIGMNADDDGFCELFTIMRMTESKPDDLRALHERDLVFIADAKVCIVNGWHTNNHIQADRYTRSKYLDDPKYGSIYKTLMEEKVAKLGRYEWIHDVSKVDTQDRIGEGSKVKDTPSKSTAKKKRQVKEFASQSDAGVIVSIIDEFAPVNPVYEQWYKNTNQRAAVDRLLVAHGADRLAKVITLLTKTNSKAYFPTITTPIELERDWAKLKSKLEQEKDKTTGVTRGRGLAN